jgi:hypothetical protein
VSELRRIRAAQPEANIKILVAIGFDRASARQELIDKYKTILANHCSEFISFGTCHRQMPNPVALARAPLGSRLFGSTRMGRPIARHHDRIWSGPELEVK